MQNSTLDDIDKNKPVKFYEGTSVFKSVGGDFYEYKKKGSQILCREVTPTMENEFLALYEFGGLYQIMMSKKDDGVKKEIGYLRRKYTTYEYKIIGEDFAFGTYDLDGWLKPDKTKGHWSVISKNICGEYENISDNLKPVNSSDLQCVSFKNEVLSVNFYNNNELSTRCFQKKDGEFLKLSNKEAKEKIWGEDKDMVEGWKPVSNLGEGAVISVASMLKSRKIR